MRLVEVRGLSDNPTDAAAAFMASAIVEVRNAIAGGDFPLCIVFDRADHTHRGWRLAVVQALAREAVPGRVNAIAGQDPDAVAAAASYLERAAGVTGQYLELAA